MKNKKKLSLLLATALMLCSLSACEQAQVQTLESINEQPRYLSFFSSSGFSTSDAPKYWIELFTETYNKQVYIDFDSASYYDDEGLSYRELLIKRMESSTPDDLYIISAEDVLEFEKKSYWMDLSHMDFVDNLSEAALYQSTYNGKVFSVPLTFTGFGFLWNVELLERNGLSVPGNLTEFLEVCEGLRSKGILPYGANKGYALTVPAMCAGFSQLYSSEDMSARIAALNSGEAQVGDYLKEGYSLLQTMIEKGYMDPEQALASTPGKEDLELFLSGECAFICSGLGVTTEERGKSFHMKMTGLPVLDEGMIAVYGANRRLCVNPESKHLETALEFVEMVGSEAALNKSAELDCVMSCAKRDTTPPLLGSEELVSLLRQPGQIPNQDFSLHFNTWESIRDVARELCAGTDVDGACALLNEKQRADLEEYSKK